MGDGYQYNCDRAEDSVTYWKDRSDHFSKEWGISISEIAKLQQKLGAALREIKRLTEPREAGIELSENEAARGCLADSGARTEFQTGAVREVVAGKGRFDLISPFALFHLARTMKNGSDKYPERNWERGIPLSKYIDSASRHLEKVKLGLTDEDHASAVLFNIAGWLHTKTLIDLGKLPKELDDMPQPLAGVDEKILKDFGLIG